MKKNLLLLLMVCGLVLATGGTATAGVIATYDSSLGTAPDAQGWDYIEVVLGDGTTTTIAGGTANMEMVVDANEIVLHCKDQLTDGAFNLPSFFYDRTEAEDQALFDDGFQLTMVVKNLGGWFCGFGFNGSVFETAANIGTDKRIGFGIASVPNDGAYHTVVIDGEFDGVNYNFTSSIDGGAPTAMAIQNNTSDGRVQDHLGFQSGSSGGTSAEVMFKYVELRSKVIDVAVSETDGMTDVTEGDAVGDFFDVKLATDPNMANSPMPDSDVTINLAIANGEVTLVPSVLTVTAGDPNDMVQTVNIIAVDDEDLEGLHEDTITITTTSDDTRYDGLTVDLLVTVTDNDGSPSFELSTEVVQVTEEPNALLHLDLADTATYEISIPFPPAQDVTVTPTDASGQVTADPVTFTAADWAAKTVTVTAVNDAAAEETPHFALLTHAVSTTDLNYGTVEPNDVAVLVTDNEVQAPATTAPYAWYKADKGTISAGGPAVDQDTLVLWGDQSGNGRSLNRVNGTGPIYEAAGPALDFSTGTLWDDRGSWGDLAHPKTIFVVADNSDDADCYFFDSTTSSGRSALFVQGSTGDLRMYAGASLVAMDPALSGNTVHTAVFADPDSSYYFNGVLQATGSAGTAELRGFLPGGRYTGSNRLTGTIQEILVYDAVLSDVERQQVEAYLMGVHLEQIEVYESNASTEVLENDPNTDSIYYAAIGNHAAMDVTGTPTGDSASEIDLGAGAGTAQTISFVGDTATEILTIDVSSTDDSESEGPEIIPVVNTSTGLTVKDVEVVLNDDERYCNDGLGQLPHLLADMNLDCYVNLEDLQIMAAQWLDCTDPFFPDDCVLVLP